MMLIAPIFMMSGPAGVVKRPAVDLRLLDTQKAQVISLHIITSQQNWYCKQNVDDSLGKREFCQ